MPESLFLKMKIRNVLDNIFLSIDTKVNDLNNSEITKDKIDTLVERISGDYLIVFPVLKLEEKQWKVDVCQVDVSGDPNKLLIDRSKPFLVAGKELKLIIPFDGDKELFDCRPNTSSMNPPQAKVANNRLIISYEITKDEDIEKVKTEAEKTLEKINNYLENLKKDIGNFNDTAKDRVRSLLEDRLKNISDAKTLEEELNA